MQQTWDPSGEAGAALTRAVEGFGSQVLGRADMLSGLLEDDVPHLPREVALLTAAARSGTSERLTERVQQGISPDQAVSMAASDMATRTAMDASGAQWAVGEFARVLGHPVQGATIPAPTRPVEPWASTQLAPPQVPATTAAAVLAGPDLTVTAAGEAPPSRGLAGTAAVATGLAGVLSLFWLLADFSGAFEVVTVLQNIVLLVASVAAAIWVARKAGRGAGFAAVFGITAAGISGAIYYVVYAASIDYLSSGRHRALEVAMAFFLAATAIAACLALAGLARGHYFARHKAGAAARVTALAGGGFALANIIPQQSYNGSSYGIFIGSNLHGWRILWAIMFLVLVAMAPLLGLFIPRPNVLRAMWLGWLAFALAWQISWNPVDSETAAPGLYVTWILWLIVLVGTIVSAIRRPAAQPAMRV
jgi:hypothetical protein